MCKLWLNLHVIDPFGVTVVKVRRLERTDVVRLAIVVPSNNLNHGESLLEDLIPAVKDQGATGEDPVLAIRDLGTEVGEEPRRNRSHVLLVTEPVLIGIVSISDRDSVTVRGSLVVAVVVPALF